MREFKFYKNDRGWWIDLPGYTAQGGDPADLQMVAGADVFLENLSEGKNEVKVQVSRQKVVPDFYMLRRCDEIPTVSGRYYFDDASDELMWLCDATLWIYGSFPETIWYKKV